MDEGQTPYSPVDCGTRTARSIDVAVCIPTYRRPRELAELLTSLAQIDFASATVVICVVDNDPEGSAAEVVAQYVSSGLKCIYRLEPEKGLVVARNALVEMAIAQGARYLAFVDDDEIVEPTWLTHLLDTASRYQADVVSGPVLSIFEEGVPEWAKRDRFFHQARHRTGTQIQLTGAGNLLIDIAWLRVLPAPPFDPRFGTTGGEDTHFCLVSAKHGARMIWCDEAIAHERIARTRANPVWLLRRSFRGGSTYSISSRAVQKGRYVTMKRLLQASASLSYGLLLLPLSLPFGKSKIMMNGCRISRGLGGILGLAGVSYQEYRAPDAMSPNIHPLER